MSDWSVLISSDLQVAPAEDAFKDVVRYLNRCFAASYVRPTDAAKLFVVLRYAERCESLSGIPAISSDLCIATQCPIRVHEFEIGAMTIDASLRLSLARVIREAGRFAEKNQVQLETQRILLALISFPEFGSQRQSSK